MGDTIFDIAVIGAGAVGSLIARELTKYSLSVALIEKNSDAATGTSKGNSAIVHAGFDAAVGTLKAKLNVRGCALMESLASDLGVRYRRNTSLVCGFSDADTAHLRGLLERGEKNGVPGLEIIGGDRLFDLEPKLSREITAALYAPTAGIVCPYHLAISAAESAAVNGAKLIFDSQVTAISDAGGFYEITHTTGITKAKYIVNSAGLYADEIATMCGDGVITQIIPRRGEYMMLDKKTGGTVDATIFAVPNEKGKGILVSPTVDGNLIVGPNANIVDKRDTSTTSEGLREIEEGAKLLVPSLNLRQVITSFAGVRSTPANHDFNIQPSEKFPRVLHLVGIESPGLASSPAIAEYAVEKLSVMGLPLIENKAFQRELAHAEAFRDMSDEERSKAVDRDPRYGKIICRCESVTEAEIVAAIHSPCPARDLDAVKRRTRAGMGRCQGGFCSPRVVEILSRELNIDMTEVTKKGGGSYILTGVTK
ncbi:FAD/NAD(P)-binding oxidoreductase [Clostridia bacterium]|nr:FAD/NAD(P)-binding oxidoreductase [Clostridia bacterium]